MNEWLREIKRSWILPVIAVETRTSSSDFLVQSYFPHYLTLSQWFCSNELYLRKEDAQRVKSVFVTLPIETQV